MDDLESNAQSAARKAAQARLDAELPTVGPLDSTGSFLASNEDLLSGTGSILMAASTGAVVDEDPIDGPDDIAYAAPAAPAAPRYVRKRAPHRSQGTVDDIADASEDSLTYTHDSNISIGGSTPLSGMAYRRSRSNMSRVKSGTRYGQYLEIPKGRRSIFASRERARRRKSVLALLAVVALLVLAAMFLWNMMQQVLG